MPTRISGACNGCRAKKQKCSGDKSGCAQCEAAGIPCTWPEQRKRGPAKGYIEGLERRLHEAESLLLHILPHVSAQQLEHATSLLGHDDVSESGRNSPGRRSSPPVLNKKMGVEYWENFPLTNVADIRRWQQDCQAHSTGQSLKPESPHRSPSVHAPSASDTKKERQSVAEPSQKPSNTTYAILTPTLNQDVFSIQDNQADLSQVLNAQNSEMRTRTDQQRRHGGWQAQMMDREVMPNNVASNPNVPQQQRLGHIEYLEDSNMNTWPPPLQGNMGIEMSDSQNQDQNQRPRVNSQTQSHLFW